MIPSDELHDLALQSGGSIRANISPRVGIQITRFDRQSRELASVNLEYPSAGFGGGGWVLSPSGRLLVLDYYSGQSEQTFALLDLSGDALKLVASPEYEFGEYASYAFSPEEDKMVMALPNACVEWWASWDDDGLEADDDGVDVLPFATLFLCSTGSGQLCRTELRLAPTVSQAIQKDKYDPDLAPRLCADSKLSLQLPWGSVTLDLSVAPSHIRIPYPAVPTA